VIFCVQTANLAIIFQILVKQASFFTTLHAVTQYVLLVGQGLMARAMTILVTVALPCKCPTKGLVVMQVLGVMHVAVEHILLLTQTDALSAQLVLLEHLYQRHAQW
jgi:hypothetical protein